jgi:hypothetical protein
MITKHGRGRCLAAVTAALLAATPAPIASADQARGPSRSDIFAQLHVDDVPADYVVLLDTSGSMAAEGRYATAIQSLTGLFDALSAEDRITLYSFDSSVNPAYLGPSRPPAEITGLLPRQPTPDGATDIGRAISAALNDLQRQDAAPIANVVFITDGDQDAPADSPYADVSAPAWATLRERASTVNSPTTSVYAVPLGDGASGAALIKSVFSNAVVLDPRNVGNLGEFLNRSKDHVKIEKARTVLGKDIGTTVDTTWDIGPVRGGAAKVTVTLTSHTANTPIDVDNLRLNTGDSTVQIDQPERHVTLEPGKSVRIVTYVRYEPSSGWPVRHSASTSFAITLSATVSSPWTGALKPEIDLGIDGPLATRSESFALSREIGPAWSLPTAIVLLIVAAAGLLLAVRLRRQVLSGVLVVSSGDQSREIASIRLRGTRVPLTAPDLPGRCMIRPVRSLWPNKEKELGLKISYVGRTSTQSAVTRRCKSGGSIILGGLYFSHIKKGS